MHSDTFSTHRIEASPFTLQIRKGDASDHLLMIGSALSECAIEIVVESDVHASVTVLQTSPEHQKISQRSTIGDNASLQSHMITLGSEAELDLVSDISGVHAQSDIDWIFYASGKDRQKLSAANHFSATHGMGQISMRGVAEGKAHVVCNGMIEIEKNGQGTDTYLSQDVLMLDKTAKVDAIPQLEIKTNDVKASHSATVSRITPEDLFYLSSRGLPERESRQMFLLGFLSASLGRLSAPLREQMEGKLLRKYQAARS